MKFFLQAALCLKIQVRFPINLSLKKPRFPIDGINLFNLLHAPYENIWPALR
jgi:hypothetical protein